VVTWGNKDYGSDSSAVASQLDGHDDSFDVKAIYSNDSAFAALRADGSVVTWGNKDYGSDSSAVASQLDGHDDSRDVKAIYSNYGAFAALREDGSVVTWGYKDYGGDSSAVASQLDGHDDSRDVKAIYSNGSAFAALRADGSVVTWGDSGSGGDSSAVASQLDGHDDSVDVKAIYSNNSGTFAALRADGSVVTWGGSVDNTSASLLKKVQGSSIFINLQAGNLQTGMGIKEAMNKIDSLNVNHLSISFLSSGSSQYSTDDLLSIQSLIKKGEINGLSVENEMNVTWQLSNQGLKDLLAFDTQKVFERPKELSKITLEFSYANNSNPKLTAKDIVDIENSLLFKSFSTSFKMHFYANIVIEDSASQINQYLQNILDFKKSFDNNSVVNS
jgi:alpha-tubulin suppressor-like RCC1 family protein